MFFNRTIKEKSTMNMGKKIVSSLLLAASVVAVQAQSGPAREKPKTEEQIRLEQMSEKFDKMQQQFQQQMDEMKQQLQQAKDAAANAQAAADQAAKKTDAVQQGLGENTQAVSGLQSTVSDLKNKLFRRHPEGPGRAEANEGGDRASRRAALQGHHVIAQRQLPRGRDGGPQRGNWRRYSYAMDLDPVQRQRTLPRPASSSVRAVSRASRCWRKGRPRRLPIAATTRRTSSPPHQLKQQPEQQLCATSAAGMGATGDAERMDVQRRTDVVACDGVQKRLDVAHGSDSVEHRPRNYVPGFVWERQYGFRIVKQINPHLWAGVSIENPQVLSPVVNGDITGLPLIPVGQSWSQWRQL